MTATPHLPRRSAEEQIRLEATLRDIFERKLCFNELLGFKVESLDPAAPQISFAMRRDLIGHYPVSYTHLDVYKRQPWTCPVRSKARSRKC